MTSIVSFDLYDLHGRNMSVEFVLSFERLQNILALLSEQVTCRSTVYGIWINMI